MNKTVPAGAAILLDFIRETEVGRKDRASYDVIYANRQNRLKQPLTTMSFGDVVEAQKAWSKSHGSSAAGAYQFMRATLIGLAKEIPSIEGSDIFTPDLQDRLGFHLLKRRGYPAFVAGELSLVEFGRRLAQEWASLPVLADTTGNEQGVKRGQSYYAGDGLNEALVKPEKVEGVLREVLAAARRPVKPEVPTAPVTHAEAAPAAAAGPASTRKAVARSGRFWTWLLTAGGSVVTALRELNLVTLDWRVQIAILTVIVGFAVYAISSMPVVREALGLK
ncbi:lysozyme family protein [Sinorhizobium chiapasense]|uniref:Transmembrane protein n=1 Tax=Sinorhizobium chiapasense TaxID=501572 RepID=A0ABZ2BE77_9HYPH